MKRKAVCAWCSAFFNARKASSKFCSKHCAASSQNQGYRDAGEPEARFWDKVQVAGDDDCWVWKAGKFPAGYGIIRYRGYHTGAHRVAYLIANGNLPDGKLICHRCGNPACCNPAHLYAGSHSDNTNDAIAHGTYKTVFQPGAMHPNWKGSSHD